MADEHDAVPGGDPQHGDESDERSERQDPAAREDEEDAADQGEEQAGDDEQGHPDGGEIREQDEEDAERARQLKRRGSSAWRPSGPRIRPGSRDDSRGGTSSPEAPARYPGRRPEVAAADVAGDFGIARRPLADDLVRGRGDDHVRDVAERDEPAGRGLDPDRTERVQFAADGRRAPDGDVEDVLVVVEFADLGPFRSGTRRRISPAVRPNRAAPRVGRGPRPGAPGPGAGP